MKQRKLIKFTFIFGTLLFMLLYYKIVAPINAYNHLNRKGTVSCTKNEYIYELTGYTWAESNVGVFFYKVKIVTEDIEHLINLNVEKVSFTENNIDILKDTTLIVSSVIVINYVGKVGVDKSTFERVFPRAKVNIYITPENSNK